LGILVVYELKSKGYSNNRYSFLFTLFLFQLRLSSRISRYLSGYLKNPKSLAKISDRGTVSPPTFPMDPQIVLRR
jgi:hypothetical protein